MEHLHIDPVALNKPGADNDNLPEEDRERPIDNLKLATGAGGTHPRKDAEALAKAIIRRTMDPELGVKFLDLDFRLIKAPDETAEELRYTIAYTISGPSAKVFEFEKLFA